MTKTEERLSTSHNQFLTTKAPNKSTSINSLTKRTSPVPLPDSLIKLLQGKPKPKRKIDKSTTTESSDEIIFIVGDNTDNKNIEKSSTKPKITSFTNSKSGNNFEANRISTTKRSFSFSFSNQNITSNKRTTPFSKQLTTSPTRQSKVLQHHTSSSRNNLPSSFTFFGIPKKSNPSRPQSQTTSLASLLNEKITTTSTVQNPSSEQFKNSAFSSNKLTTKDIFLKATPSTNKPFISTISSISRGNTKPTIIFKTSLSGNSFTPSSPLASPNAFRPSTYFTPFFISNTTTTLKPSFTTGVKFTLPEGNSIPTNRIGGTTFVRERSSFPAYIWIWPRDRIIRNTPSSSKPHIHAL